MRPARWIITIGAAAGLAALGVWAFLAGRQELASEQQRESPVSAPSRVSRGPEGQTVITLDSQAQQRIGLRTDILKSISFQPQLLAFGTLQADPAQVFVLRSPIAGTLRSAGRQRWPELGEKLAKGTAVGSVEPRFTPTEGLDRAARLASARADVTANRALVDADQAGYERLQSLNAQESHSVSLRVLQDAQAKLAGDQARFNAAVQTVKILESATSDQTHPSGPMPLIVNRAGQVVQRAASPGEAVDNGQPLLTIENFGELIAAVSILPGQTIDRSAPTARIVVLGDEKHPLVGERGAVAPMADPNTLAQTFLFHVSTENGGLRPGMAVTAYLAASGKPEQGVVIPRPAVVYLQGKAWAYAQSGPDTFERREVPTGQPAKTGWFVDTGWSAGQRIVIQSAQVLLSEEFKSQIQLGD